MRWWFWRDRVDPTIDALIRPVRFGSRFAGQDDARRTFTQQRRQAADKMRAQASRVEAGEPVSELLRIQRVK